MACLEPVGDKGSEGNTSHHGPACLNPTNGAERPISSSSLLELGHPIQKHPEPRADRMAGACWLDWRFPVGVLGAVVLLALTFFDARNAMPWATWLENCSRSERLRGRRSSLVSSSSSELFPEIQSEVLELLQTWRIMQAMLYPGSLGLNQTGSPE